MRPMDLKKEAKTVMVRKVCIIAVYLPVDLRDKIQQQAASRGNLSVSEFVRGILLERFAPPELQGGAQK